MAIYHQATRLADPLRIGSTHGVSDGRPARRSAGEVRSEAGESVDPSDSMPAMASRDAPDVGQDVIAELSGVGSDSFDVER